MVRARQIVLGKKDKVMIADSKRIMRHRFRFLLEAIEADVSAPATMRRAACVKVAGLAGAFTLVEELVICLEYLTEPVICLEAFDSGNTRSEYTWPKDVTPNPGVDMGNARSESVGAVDVPPNPGVDMGNARSESVGAVDITPNPGVDMGNARSKSVVVMESTSNLGVDIGNLRSESVGAMYATPNLGVGPRGLRYLKSTYSPPRGTTYIELRGTTVLDAGTSILTAAQQNRPRLAFPKLPVLSLPVAVGTDIKFRLVTLLFSIITRVELLTRITKKDRNCNVIFITLLTFLNGP